MPDVNDCYTPAEIIGPDKPKRQSTQPHRIRAGSDKIELGTVAGVCREMARIYRLRLNEHISLVECAKMIFCLTQIRMAIESMIAHEPRLLNPPPRLEGPLISISTVPPGCYLTAEMIAKIKEVEYRNEFGHAAGSSFGNGNGHAANGNGHIKDIKDADDDGTLN